MATKPKLQIIKFSDLEENEVHESPTWIIQPSKLAEVKVQEILLDK